MRHLISIFALLIMALFWSMATGDISALDEGPAAEKYLLKWDAKEGVSYTYMLSTSGSKGEHITVRTENFDFIADKVEDGVMHFTATGEPVPDRARLSFRFQRAYFPRFYFSVSENGSTEAVPGQPFPPLINIPLFPDYPVGEGDVWSGGPVGILTDQNVGAIPFRYESSLKSMAVFRGEMCAVIESEYTVELPEDSVSMVPFLGLVEGDEPEEPGNGAIIGGVVEGSRAHEAGIQPGDFIIEAEGERIRGWGGLHEILPVIAPEVPVEFTVRRGDDELEIEVIPKAIPLAIIEGTGQLHSTVFFSAERGIPMKIDVESEDLKFTLTNPEGESEERAADLHIVLEYQYSGEAGSTE